MQGLSAGQEKELKQLWTDTCEGALGQEEFSRLIRTLGLEPTRPRLSDEALEREATEAARASRRARQMKVLEWRQEQLAKEEAEEAKQKAQSQSRALAALEAAEARAEAAAAALLGEEYGSTESITGRKVKVSLADDGTPPR
jgi:hypothetical protein